MGQTRIEWCDKSWNPITGCSHAGSPGCDNCYARRMANRLKGRYGYDKDDPFKVTFHPDRLAEPLHWKKPSRIFVCSMGDLFHEDVTFDCIEEIYWMQIRAYQHTYLWLTKRPERMRQYFKHHELPPDYLKLFLGVSIENQRTADERVLELLKIPAEKHFISVEPMLEFVNIPWPDGWHQNSHIDWVICGGETGPKARPMHPDWVTSLRDQCQAAGVSLFFKQWGEWDIDYEHPTHIVMRDGTCEPINRSNCCSGVAIRRVGKNKAGRLLNGKEYREFPTEEG